MHTITLHSDENFYKTLNEMVKKFHTTEIELIQKALLHYKNSIEENELKNQIKNASLKVREDSKKTTKEFDYIIDDGLKSV
jgi:hypothetical protein